MSEPGNSEPVSGFWPQVEEIFHQALDVPASTRAAFVGERCAGDAALEHQVREILAGYEAQDRVATLRGDKSPEGSRFGAFEIVHKIAEGGMGAVYLARRSGDFEQRAAIKLINGTPAAAALMSERFRQERQILAALEHPNIARLLDGGVSSDGQPYLVMEYVEGVRLDQYCASQNLSIPRRLELFRKICAAVHFAHQHLVIHRDLKPGNILVTPEGEPKLLDFGIAKVLEAPGSAPEQTLTVSAGVLMTPEYASPEQAQGLSSTLSSDIYSLGVVLYELLTGKGPYPVAARTPAQWIATVVTAEIQRPSVVAAENLKPRLRGDLDGIVMKAMAKKPEERYGSVEQLSEDIQRHLEGLPVTAVEGSRLYVARKFVRRHRVSVAGAAMVLASLIAGLAGTLWQAKVAGRERALAEQRFSDARKLANYLLYPLFDAVQPLPGSLPVRADMATQSLAYLDRLSAAKSQDRALRLELAEGYLRLGAILQAPSGYGDSLGSSGQALESDRKALALLQPVEQEDHGNEQVRRDLARGYLLLGPALNLQSKPRDGIETLQRSVAIYDQLSAAKPQDAARLLDAGRAWETLMDVAASPGGGFQDVSTKDQVTTAGSKAIERFRAALAISPAESDAWHGIARVYMTQGGMQSANDPPRGLATIRQGLDAFHQLPQAMQSSPEGLVDEATLESAVGFAEQRMGHYPEALAALERARQILDAQAVVDPRNASNEARRGNLYLTRAQIYMKMRKRSEGLADYLKVIEIYSGMVAVDPKKTSSRMIRAVCEAFASRLLLEQGRTSDGAKYAKDGLDDLENLADQPGATAQYLREASIALMVTPIPALRDYPRALRYALRADELSNGKEPTAVAYLAMAYANTGDAPKALETVERGLAIVPAAAPGQNPSEARLNLENELRDIKILIKTGKLPPGFNQ